MPNFFLLHSLLDLLSTSLSTANTFIDKLVEIDDKNIIADELKELEKIVTDTLAFVQDTKDKLSKEQ